MILFKKDVKFKIINHKMISSPTGLRKELWAISKSNNGDKTFVYTNCGFAEIKESSSSIICPASLYPLEAKQIIKDLPDEFQGIAA
jgi:hypothetical protein